MARRILILPVLASALMLCSTVNAQGLGYNHVEVGFSRGETGDDDLTVEGVQVSGSWLITSNVFLTAGFSDADTDYFPGTPVWAESEQFAVGAGYRVGLAEATDWVTRVSYLRDKVTWRTRYFRLDSESDDGAVFSTGIRHLWTERVEVAAAIRYAELFGDGQTYLDGSAVYHLNTSIGLRGGYSYSDDSHGFNVGVRIKF